MKGIKTTLIFLFGAIYTSCIWLLFVLPVGSDYKIIPTIFLLLSSAVIIAFVLVWLAEHWNDE